MRFLSLVSTRCLRVMVGKLVRGLYMFSARVLLIAMESKAMLARGL